MNLDITPGADLGQVALNPEHDAQGTALVSVNAVPSVEALIAEAVKHDISVEGLEKLLAMHERMQATAAKRSFLEALSAFQADCPVIEKGKTAKIDTKSGGQFSYRYAPLEDIMKAITPSLRRYGLSIRFDAAFEANPPAQVVTCIVNHCDGHSERSEFRSPVDTGARMSVMQQAASSLTYGRRYALLNALGIVVGGEDDDGRGAGGGGGPREVPRPTSVPRPSFEGPAEGSATTPRPIGRNLVRIPHPAQGPQGSDGPSLQGDNPQVSPVAETPAAPEGGANDEPKTEIRVGLIKDWSRLLRATGKFDGLSDDEMWDKATDVLSAQCEIQFRRPLHEMNLAALRAARTMTDETLAKKGLEKVA